MSRAATKWAYGPKIQELRLTQLELALLRALCWATNPEKNVTDALTDRRLGRLTGYKTSGKIEAARQLLENRKLIKFLYASDAGEATGAKPKKKNKTEIPRIYFVCIDREDY